MMAWVCGIYVIIAGKEQKSGLKVPIQHFFDELGKENDGECNVTNGVNP